MDFGWALQAMDNGERVRREAWSQLAHIDHEYMTLEKVTPHGVLTPDDVWEPILVVTTFAGKRTMFNPSHTQLLAQDWEIA